MQKLRMSMLGDFETCPYLCKVLWGEVGDLGKVDEEGSQTNKYASVGIVLHEVMEIQGLNKMDSKSDIKLETLHEILDKKFDEQDVSLFKDVEEFEGYRTSLHEQLDWGYQEACLEHVSPIGVEVTFHLDDLLPDCLPFSGTMDRIVGNLETKQVAIEDWKTGKVYTKKELSSNIQATVYSLAFYKMFGFLPEEFRFYFTKFKKTKVVKITPEFLKQGTTRILENWFKIKQGEFTADTSNKFFCKNFCSISKECPCMKRVQAKGWESVN